MEQKIITPLVYTDKDKCNRCYACVKVCPVKAIRISQNCVEVIPERCIGCGNCITICSTGAHQYRSSKANLNELKKSGAVLAAIIDPSIPGEFVDISHYSRFVGMIRQLGFEYVNEISFGADLVGQKYKELFASSKDKFYITANCPAVVKYVEKYQPELVPNLAPIVTPMVATAKVVRQMYGDDLKVVAIGPCIAAKDEALATSGQGKVDEVITYQELRELFEENGITEKYVNAREFDAPIGCKGSLFLISRGMLQSVDIDKDLTSSQVLSTEGTTNFPEAIKQYSSSPTLQRHLDLFSCEGCVMGPGTSRGGKKFIRRSLVIDYVNRRLKKFDSELWLKHLKKFEPIDLSRTFKVDDQRLPAPSEEQLREILDDLGQDHKGCGSCGYESCMEFAQAISAGLARKEMCPSYSVRKIKEVNTNLDSTKAALEQSERLAHMGQLSAGIAHELNNPLGVVIMYCNILLDECAEDSPIREDLELIVSQANRCKKIVGGLLNFARKNQINTEKTDALKLIKDSVAATIIPDNISIKIDNKLANTSIFVDYEQMLQVFTNIFKNAVDAMPGGGKILVSMEDESQMVAFHVSDTGNGIPPENMDKVFTPFFTTKEMGKGTGLGLATVYGIIKMHQGNILVSSNNNPSAGPTGTKLKITIPRNRLLKSIEPM